MWTWVKTGAPQPHLQLASRAAIGAWAAQTHQGLLAGIRTSHHQSGVLFDVLTAEQARTRTMILVTMQGPTEAVPRLFLSGVYHDEWRKTAEGWRLVHRTLHE